MKNSGLQNRFSPNDTYVWMFWYKCMWCGENKWDCLHHIISPSSLDHRLGEFNSSILNSSPMHNRKCHIDNGLLHHRDIEIKLLEKTMTALKYDGYILTNLDRAFTEAYWDTHFKHFNNLLK